MVSKVGDDMLGDGVLQNFERTGVDARHVERVNGQSTGTATILVDKSGDNCILIVKGANGDLTPEDVERAGDDLKTCDLILTQLEVPLETVYATLAFGKRRGVKTALNPAPAVRDLDMERAREASFLMPNETELAILTGLPVEFEAEVAAAAHSLVGRGCRGGHRHPRRPRRAPGDTGGRAADRAGQGRGDRHHRRRRCFHRQLRPLPRRRPFPRRRARPGDPLRRLLGHPARGAEVICDRGRVRSVLRQARVRERAGALDPPLPRAGEGWGEGVLCTFHRAMVD